MMCGWRNVLDRPIQNKEIGGLLLRTGWTMLPSCSGSARSFWSSTDGILALATWSSVNQLAGRQNATGTGDRDLAPLGLLTGSADEGSHRWDRIPLIWRRAK